MITASRLRCLASLPIVLLVLAGCSNEPGPGGRRGGFAGGRGKPPTPMAGQEQFFNGQILAEIKVGTDGVPTVGPGEGGGGSGGGGGDGHGRRGGGGGGGGMSLRGGGGGMSGDISGGMPFGGGGEGRGGGYGEGGGPSGPRPMMGAMGRPVMIHLRFTNSGTEAAVLHIDDFVSPLGNFAVRPEKLVLEPGQSLETEPMTSQLASEFSETNATLVLRVGPKTEKKTFTLRAVTPPVPPATEPPAEPAK